MRIPVGMYTCSLYALIRDLVSALLACDPGEIYLVFLPLLVDHEHMNQVFIDGSIQVIQAEWTEEIHPLPFFETEAGMLDARVIPHLRMKKQ
jgi:hypothetical protein